MIEASDFVEAAKQHGFKRYTGVPCSFLTPFINYVINDDSLNYVSSANEGDALATAAGAALAGERSIVMMQNSGLGNAVSPITSLSWVFRIPFIIITTHRGQPGLADEPQHELMGLITGDMLDTMQVPWEVFPKEQGEIEAALARAMAYMNEHHRPYGFIMEKGTVAKHELKRDAVPSVARETIRKTFKSGKSFSNRNQALRAIIKQTPLDRSVIIATTGFTGRELFAIEDRSNQLYMVGSMGCASSLALGIALAREDLTVAVIDGDGAGLMRMGNFATLGSYAGSNLIHILLDNEVHDSTGAQSTVAGNIDFAAIAEACGYAVSFKGHDVSLIDELFDYQNTSGPRFGLLKISSGTINNLPRPDIKPADVLKRLMQHIDSEF